MIPIKPLNKKDFAKYGKIICQEKENEIFQVVMSEKEKTGWRIGYLVMGPGKADGLEAHPESYETFEPVSGTAVMLVAEEKTPDKIEAFLLDKPICINKKVWHGVSVLSEKCEIKIMENLEVESIYYKLEKPVEPGLA
ncbi:MAG: ureidoglycolate hydrolase [Candidatus Aerophobetes bacterium ADurb.Bin490]|nr:MAG: ureidoglycolate hydrolase [Candidatus Aerophobetes bacterium ADurb.Bin490]HNZ29473.1 hypothetical protein [Candidatus Goldiibacteriota bacterium]HPI02932.1 hypothetical protein [Candidatus Goldiibacteriota bacterium]HPN63612.1 hypothetical protein [Candidatus Goldiibacteriota bacterium]HRQ42891.1 hypothetical protein [Candidatus Goldiibacteriota bacterium]